MLKSIFNKRPKAQAMVEFALVLPILLLLIVGIMETGRLLFIYASTVTAARQAVRYGSTTGNNTAGIPYYLDCGGIRNAAKSVGFLNNFADNDITVTYDGGFDSGGNVINITSPAPDCPSGATTGSLVNAQNGDRVKVQVKTHWEPMVPLVPSFGGFDIISSSERTIIVSVGVAITGIPPTFSGTGGVPQLTIVANPTTYSYVGETINYTYTLTNIGTTTILGPLFSIYDPVPKVTINCPASPPQLPPGASFTCTGSYQITQTDLDNGSLTVNGVTSPVVATASNTILAVQNADFTFTKTPSVPSSVTNVTYTYQLTNIGNVTFNSFTISDDKLGNIPMGDCNRTSFAPGVTATCTVPHTILDSEKGGVLTNHATAVATYKQYTLGALVDTDVTRAAQADVVTTEISMIVSGTLSQYTTPPPPYSSQTQTITYLFTITNHLTTPVTVSSVTIDNFSGKGIYPSVSCTGSIAAGGNKVCSITYTIALADFDTLDPTNSSSAKAIHLQATVHATDGVKNYTSTGAVDTTPERHPEGTVTVTASPLLAPTAGTSVTMTYTITNTGNTTLAAPSGGFVVTDTKTSPITCLSPSASIIPGGTKVCTGTHTITATDVNDGVVLGQVSTSAVSGATITITGQSLIITSTTPKIKLSITASPTVVLGTGATITYTYTVTNIGNSALSGINFSAGYKGSAPSCGATSLALGASTTCTGTYTTVSADIGTTIVNTATVNATVATPPPATVSSTASVSVTDVQPTACILTHGALDTSLVPPFGMTLTNHNNYPVDVSSFQIYFVTGAGQKLQQVSLASSAIWNGNSGTSGATQTASGSTTIAAGATAMIAVTNWAKTYVPDGSTERIVVNFAPIGTLTCPSMDSSVPTSVPNSDLAVTKDDGVTTVNYTNSTTYTIHVVNNGPDPITGATLTDPAATGLTKTAVVCSPTPGKCVTPPSITMLESGYFALPTLLSGETYEIKVTATVTATNGTVSNNATVAVPAGANDSVGSNNSATDTDNVFTPQSDMAITKDNGTTTLNAGSATTYTIRVTNNGPDPVTGAILTDAAVTGLAKTAVACSATPGACTAGTTPTVAQLEAGYTLPASITLASGQFYEITVTANVTGSGSVSNVATITAPVGTVDSTNNNNTATDTDTVVTPNADLAITKDDAATSIAVGSNTVYTIRVTNNGPSSVTGAILTDAAATGLSKTAIACSATPGQCTAGTTPSITQIQAGYALPALASGQFYEISVTASVTASSGNVSNTAAIAVPVSFADPNSSNNSATDTDSIFVPNADLAVTKTNSSASVNAGSSTIYTIRVTNGGPSSVTGALLTDAAVSGLSKIAIACSATPGQCTAGTTPSIAQLQAGYALPALASGDFYEITVTASVTATSGSVNNTATIAAPSGATDSNAINNSATDTDTVNPVADLAVTKTDNATKVFKGGSTTYTITVTNNGPSDVTNATVVDTAPTGLTFGTWTCAVTTAGSGSVTTACGTASGSGNLNTTVTMRNGAVITYTVNATVSSSAPASIANTVTVTPPSGTTDPSTPNTATDTDTVINACATVGTTNAFDLTVTTVNLVSKVATWKITNNLTLPLPFTSINMAWTATNRNLTAFTFDNGTVFNTPLTLPDAASPALTSAGTLNTGMTTFTLTYGSAPTTISITITFPAPHGSCTHTSTMTVP